jgi:hypothetical protein
MPRPKLSNISTSTLQAELQRRLAKLGDLVAQRDALDEQISQLQGLAGQAQEAPQAAAAAGKTPGRKPGRKPRTVRVTGKPLAEYVREVLAATTLGVGMTDIEEAVLAAGYPTKATSIYKPIMKVLSKVGAKRRARGVYSLSAAGKVARKATRKAVAPAAAKAMAPSKRRTYAQTAEQFVLGLVQGKGATTAEINQAWKGAKRVGRADNTLNKMVKAGLLKRKKLAEGKGSTYTVA